MPITHRNLKTGTTAVAALLVLTFANSVAMAYPVAWSEREAVNWRVPLAGAGGGLPVVTDDAVVVTLADAEEGRCTVLCLERADGELRWRRTFAPGDDETLQPHADSTPVSDGETVYVSLGALGVHALAMADGKLLWQRRRDPHNEPWGTVAGLKLVDDLLIVHQTSQHDRTLQALHAGTGQQVWRRPLGTSGDSTATPVVRQSPFGTELIVSLPGEIAAFNPITGRPYWRCRGLGERIATSAIVGEQHIAAADAQGAVIAMQLPGAQSGDVTAGTRLWQRPPPNEPHLATGVIVHDHLYLADAAGTLECVKLETGEILWRENLGAGVRASINLAEGRLYVTDVEGRTHVIRPGRTFDRIATNKLAKHDRVTVTPTFDSGQVFVRTQAHLYCIGVRRGGP